MKSINIKRASLSVAMLVALAGCGGSSSSGGSGGTLGEVTDDNALAVAVAAYRDLAILPLIPQLLDTVAELVVLDVTGTQTGQVDCDTSGRVERRELTSERFDERLIAEACRFDTDDFDTTASFTLDRGPDRDWPEFEVGFPPGPGLEAEGIQDHHALSGPMTLHEERLTDGMTVSNEFSGSITRRVGVVAPGLYPGEGEDYRLRWEYEARDLRFSQTVTPAGEGAEPQQLGIDLGRNARLVADKVFDIENNGGASLITREARIAIEGRIRVDDAGLFDVDGRDLGFDLIPESPPSVDEVRFQPDFLGLGSLFGLRCPSIGVLDVAGANDTGLRIVFTAGASHAVFMQVFSAEATRTLRFEFCSDFLDMSPMD
ncbi:MAG: hypothetical protein LAT61_09205 [Alcanivorax sp.]|nr:hypothetical protein [Alcanivorax sp.]